MGFKDRKIDCQFCLKMTVYSPIEEINKYGVGVYFCVDCQAEYLFFKNGAKASSSLYVNINDKVYRWTVSSVGTAQLWYVKDPGIPGVKKNDGMVALKGFDEWRGDIIPQLTPQNINEKIRTWLIFL